nr:MAG TPA: hypothetical protein [Caudoviricetes sp.]
MERLTFDGEFCDISMCREELGGPFCEEGYCSQRRVWERLKSIEDILGGDYNLDRLRELVQADREGRCVVLPCMIGDTVYVLNHHLGRVFENEVAGFSVGYPSDNRNNVSTVYVGKYGSKTFRRWKFQRFGKTVFLTREEAEAALREEIADER